MFAHKAGTVHSVYQVIRDGVVISEHTRKSAALKARKQAGNGARLRLTMKPA